ncbi:hypothetical protein [Streptomyces benahoarensis]|uniref:Uncharacterized protein n=1 Tax=Streptomyces benahoarensis TaxID=2595054 RepID=A0A553YVW8_9ACTN|nr:hypothetical protein [Streptomyces benahoarensis]TSB18070.1 hypothetical protein FNJ62_25290 [Streptomyces benahoarensis]TSB33133.1 hypothetical protein FNZ23_24165 [Streptomyces benahoarensis]
MTQARIIDFPGSSIRLERDVEAMSEDHIGLARLAIASVFQFSQRLCIPLAMEVETSYWDNEFDLPITSPSRLREFGILRCSNLPEGLTVDPRGRNSPVTNVQEVSESVALEFVESLLAEDAFDAAGLSIGWQEIEFNGMMARLPENFLPEGEQTVSLEVARGHVEHPVKSIGDTSWIYGPIGASVVHAPFEYRIHRDQGEIALDISTYWSLWAPGGPGRHDVDRAVETLLKDGWQRS